MDEKPHSPLNAVVAAHWRYGSQLNVIAGVNTIIDQDHYIQHWIHLYHTHIHKGTDETEALTFLKTHGATTHHAHRCRCRKNRPYPSNSVTHLYRFIQRQTAQVLKSKFGRFTIHPISKTDRKYLKTGFAEIDDPSED